MAQGVDGSSQKGFFHLCVDLVLCAARNRFAPPTRKGDIPLKDIMKKLTLHTETVRNLTEAELKIVVGGVASAATDCDNPHCWGCPTTDGTKPAN